MEHKTQEVNNNKNNNNIIIITQEKNESEHRHRHGDEGQLDRVRTLGDRNRSRGAALRRCMLQLVWGVCGAKKNRNKEK
jgi:hypothetical protein